jgi:hypothetical protein
VRRNPACDPQKTVRAAIAPSTAIVAGIGDRLSARRQLESVLRSGCELMRAADGRLRVGVELTERYDIAG